MNAWLTVHLIGAVLFLGNIITAAYWKVRAELRKDPKAIHEAVSGVMQADWIFTLPGIALLVVSGSVMAGQAGYPMSGMNWLTASLALFAVTGALWLGLLIPLQRSMIRHAARSVERGGLTPEYRRASVRWNAFGIAATLLPVVILYLMVSKGF